MTSVCKQCSILLTCWSGLSEQRISCMHTGHHGSRGGVCDGSRIVVMSLGGLSFQSFSLREHSLWTHTNISLI